MLCVFQRVQLDVQHVAMVLSASPAAATMHPSLALLLTNAAVNLSCYLLSFLTSPLYTKVD